MLQDQGVFRNLQIDWNCKEHEQLIGYNSLLSSDTEKIIIWVINCDS